MCWRQCSYTAILCKFTVTDTQEFSHFIWNRQLHCKFTCAHHSAKTCLSSPNLPIIYFCYILLLTFHPYLGLTSLFTYVLKPKFCMHFLLYMFLTFPAYPVCNISTWNTFGEEYNSWSCSVQLSTALWHFLPLIAYYLLGDYWMLCVGDMYCDD